MESQIEERLANQEAERLMDKIMKGGPTVRLPSPVHSDIVKEREVDGDEEYWLQNVTPCAENVSDFNKTIEKEASVVEFVENEDAKKSFIGSVRELEEEQEMKANVS